MEVQVNELYFLHNIKCSNKVPSVKLEVMSDVQIRA